MSSNTSVSMAGLDFADIKFNLNTFLSSQSVFKDYNFAGSGLSVLTDILAFNTQYNAYYLNMVANEMFLDSALQRSSVVSHGKLLGYTPRSAIAPTAFIKLVVGNVNTTSLTLPQNTQFISRAINGVNYTFVTDDAITVNAVSRTATFDNLTIKQGIPSTFSFSVNSTSNPNYIFEIPDVNIDTSTLKVTVQQSNSNTNTQVFDISANHLLLDGKSLVYFIQEGRTGNYQIYFGDDILGKKLTDGNIVNVNYLSTHGISAVGANNFTMMQSIGGNASVFPITPASNGSAKESINSIKFQAPKAFSAQNRAVTKNDYISIISRNTIGITFDAVNVWGGEEETINPTYGNIYISLKPSGSYALTESQKMALVKNVISPMSVITVKPTIIDPDYTYLQLMLNVHYNQSQTTKTSNILSLGIENAVYGFASNTLNTFNSTFSPAALLNTIQNYDSSIVSSDYDLKIQKKLFPNLSVPTTYTLNYNTPLQKGQLLSGVSCSPALQYRDPVNATNIITGVGIEEVPVNSNGVDSVLVLNPGAFYQATPTITILGDGTGATATCALVAGSISNVTITNTGIGYTSAVAVITPQPQDTTGKLAVLVVKLQGNIGTLRTFYINPQNVKTILNTNIGTIDYVNGVITLTGFNPVSVDNPLGQLAITATPVSSMLTSTFNGIITIDPYDPAAITVNVITQP